MKHLEASSVCPSAGINLEVIDMKYYNMSGKHSDINFKAWMHLYFKG